jgi:hypothetical protein
VRALPALAVFDVATGAVVVADACAAVADGVLRVITDCHFRKTATEFDRKPGIKWLSCTAK